MILSKKNEYYRKRWFRIAARIFYTAAIPILFLWVCVFNGARIAGTQNVRGLGSAVTVCNHVYKLDSWLVASAFYPRMLVFPTVPEKIDNFFPGIFFSLLGCISVPRRYGETNTFFGELEISLNQGRISHFFPEGSISPYSIEIRSFKRGAFYLAAKAQVPIVPMAITFHKPKGFYKLIRKNPAMRLTIGEPMAPCSLDVKEDERIRMESACRQIEKMILGN